MRSCDEITELAVSMSGVQNSIDFGCFVSIVRLSFQPKGTALDRCTCNPGDGVSTESGKCIM